MAYSKARRLAEIVADTNGNISVEGLVVPTQSASDNDTSAASTAYVTTAVSGLIDSAPSTLNTLNEIAAALGDNENFNTTVTAAIAAKLPLAGGTLTGNLVIQNDGGNEQFVIKRQSAQNEQLILGFHSSDYGTIQAIEQGVAYRPLILNPSGGNVGIGITSPSHALHISGANNDAARVRVHNSASGQASLDLDNSEGYFRTFTDAGEYRIYDQTDGAYRLLINTSGNVGMGPSSPLSRLHISGNSDVSDEACMLTIDDEDTSTGSMIPAIQFRGNGNNLARIRANDQQGLLLSGSSGQGDDIVVQAGKVGMGTNSPAVAKGLHINSAGNSELRLTTTQDSGTPTAQIGYGAGSGYFLRLGNAANNENIMFRTYGDSYIANNLGIGINNPTHPLHVQVNVSNDTIDETKGLVKFQSSGGNGMIFGTIASSPYTSYIQSAYVIDTSIAQYNLSLNPIGGNVGIGTTSPGQKLEVNGTAKFSNTQMTSTVPLTFLANNSDNTYMQTTTYAHQNNSSGNFNNGIHIEMGRITNSNSAEIRAFVIGARGGQSAFKVLGNDKQAGITQDDGDFMGRLYVSAGDAFLSLSTGEAAPVERTRISSYGRSFINSNSNGLNATNGRAALSVGADINQRAGKLAVYGGGSSGDNGGIMHYNGVGREYRNVVSTHTATSSSRYWHIKTNFFATNNVMFIARVHGYSYGNGGSIVDIQRSGYAYSSHGQLTGSQTVNNGSSSDTLEVYFASDNYVCFRHTTPVSGYYNGYSFDIKFQSPTGYNWNFEVLGHAINSTSGNHF